MISTSGRLILGAKLRLLTINPEDRMMKTGKLCLAAIAACTAAAVSMPAMATAECKL
jgi:hypothetical protein